MVLSLLLSIISYQHHQPYNTDGILYLNAASAFLHGQFHVGLEIYRWPLYSLSIAALAKLLPLSIPHAAFTLNVLLDTLTVFSFMAIIDYTAQRPRLTALAALTILAFPYINHFRYDIMRGHGYVAFALLGFYCFIRFVKNNSWEMALAWQVSLVMATLFRIEGAIYLIALPLPLLFMSHASWKQKASQFLKPYTLLFLASGAALLFYVLSPSSFQHLHYSRLGEISSQLSHGLQRATMTYQDKVLLLGQYVLGYHGSLNAPTILFSGMLGLLIATISNNLGIVYSCLSLLGLFKSHSAQQPALKWIVPWVIVLSALIGVVFVFQHYFISQRYIILLSLGLMLFIPNILEYIWFQQAHRFSKVLLSIALLYVATSGIGHFGHSKTYIIHAADFIQSKMGSDVTFFANDGELAFNIKGIHSDNSSHFLPEALSLEALLSSKPHQFKVAAVKFDAKNKESIEKIKQHLKMAPTKTFCNKQKDCVYVFILPVRKQ